MLWYLENKGLSDPAEIEKALQLGEFIKRGGFK
jgi:hypothetical protein